MPAPGGHGDYGYLWCEHGPQGGATSRPSPLSPRALPGCGWQQPLKVDLLINGYFKYCLIRMTC